MKLQTVNADSKANDEDVSLVDIIFVVKRWFSYILNKRLFLLIAFVLGAVLSFGIFHFKKPIYTGTTTFVLEEGDGGTGLNQYAGVAAMIGVDLGSGGGLFQSDNIIELYKSRRMLQRALLNSDAFNGKQMLLIDRFLSFHEMRDSWSRPELKSLSFENPDDFTILHDSILAVVIADIRKDQLVVEKVDKKLNILKVEVKSPDEQFAKKFNDHLVSTVNQFYIDTKTKKSLENISILQRQTDSVRAYISGSISYAAQSIDAVPNINPARQALRAPVQRSQVNIESNKAMLAELVKNLEISKIALRKETPLIQVVDTPIYPLPKQEVDKVGAMILGGFLFVILCVIYLTLRNYYIRLINGI